MGLWGDIKEGYNKVKNSDAGWFIPGVNAHKVVDKIGEDPAADQERRRKALLEQQARQAGNFASVGELGYGRMGKEAEAVRETLRRQAMGQDSLSSEQLRQGVQQQQAASQSMAAGASPANAAMAARTAANNMAAANYGMAGQAATAGIQERSAANQVLGQMILGQRGQDMNVALGSRQTALNGYSPQNQGPPEKSWYDKYGRAIENGAKAYFGGA